jgi:N-formylglutamate deformylase
MHNKLILHVPHSSSKIPDKSGYVVRDTELETEMLLLTDWHTEELFSFNAGVSVVADFNRNFCDVERFANDELEVMAKAGMGVIYTKRDDGSSLRNVSPKLRNDILDKYYYPHHEKLNAAVTEQLTNNGRALITDCHSFSNEPFKRDLNKDTPRPDICIGTDEFHTPPGLIKFTETFFKLAGYKVKINIPYSGSIVPIDSYLKDSRVHSVMIELNRDLYLVSGTNKKSRGYNRIRSVINNYLYKISKLDYNNNIDLLTQGTYIPPPSQAKL